MASLSHLLPFLSLIFFLKSTFPAPGFHPNSAFFPVTKDSATLQYVASVSHGSPLQPTKLVVDLGGPFIWMDCDSGHVSSPYRAVSGCSVNCSRAKSQDLGNGCISSTNCNVFLHNGITGMTNHGELVEDIVAVDAVDRLEVGRITAVDHFFFSCAPTFLLQGLAGGTKGMLGLGKSSISLPSQFSSSIGHSEKFFVCLSSSNGFVLTGNGETLLGTKLARSLSYTPFSTDQHEYSINVQSIKINGKRLAIDKPRSTKLSTVLPYTTMESSIYGVFSKAYVKAAYAMNMSVVSAVSPFDLCFSYEGVENSMLGPVVPEIDLILQSEMVKWKIYGRNLMVRVSNKVVCLGILDGGFKQSSSIVLGGFQLEDNLLEFDFGSSMLGFSSSLLLVKDTTCSSFLPDSKLKQFM